MRQRQILQRKNNEVKCVAQGNEGDGEETAAFYIHVFDARVGWRDDERDHAEKQEEPGDEKSLE